jgi:Dyp-type peroxidase family
MESIDKKELQGILVRGYSKLQAACYLLLQVRSAPAAKAWLAGHLHLVTPGHSKDHTVALNIAFTIRGLQLFGLDEGSVATFPFEFQDGIDTPHKQRLLGDYGKSDPANWNWGGKKNKPIHVLLMLYATDCATLANHYASISSQWKEDAFEEIAKLDTKEITARKEHFGFHDGISQPAIAGLGRTGEPSANTVAAGEFILGYKNEYGQFTASPAVPAASDKKALLSPSRPDAPLNAASSASSNAYAKDLGQNGSFLVFRQMEQNVRKFWDFMEDKTRNEDGSCDPQEMIRLASKTVGRWPSGTSLELSPDKDNPDYEKKNDFDYIPKDKEGLVCPFGAHVRRTNPRDSINRGDANSVAVSKKHRILRRGRSYGAPLAPSMSPEDILKSKDDGAERGLYFICLNADLGRQFEFIQNFWINNPKFDGLYDERDPLTGNHSNPQEQRTTGTFAIPQEEMRQRFTDLPEFVTIKGGAYFFLPGMRALEYISSL